MKYGIELITEERIEKQIKKHGFTGEHHADHPEWYADCQLQKAAADLLEASLNYRERKVPLNWDIEWWKRLCNRTQKERLIIAGTFIVSELDRMVVIEKRRREADPQL